MCKAATVAEPLLHFSYYCKMRRACVVCSLRHDTCFSCVEYSVKQEFLFMRKYLGRHHSCSGGFHTLLTLQSCGAEISPDRLRQHYPPIGVVGVILTRCLWASSIWLRLLCLLWWCVTNLQLISLSGKEKAVDWHPDGKKLSSGVWKKV